MVSKLAGHGNSSNVDDSIKYSQYRPTERDMDSSSRVASARDSVHVIAGFSEYSEGVSGHAGVGSLNSAGL